MIIFSNYDRHGDVESPWPTCDHFECCNIDSNHLHIVYFVTSNSLDEKKEGQEKLPSARHKIDASGDDWHT